MEFLMALFNYVQCLVSCDWCVLCSCVHCSSSAHLAPAKKATVPIYKVLVRPVAIQFICGKVLLRYYQRLSRRGDSKGVPGWAMAPTDFCLAPPVFSTIPGSKSFV